MYFAICYGNKFIHSFKRKFSGGLCFRQQRSRRRRRRVTISLDLRRVA